MSKSKKTNYTGSKTPTKKKQTKEINKDKLENVKWKPFLDHLFKDMYEASNKGDVRNKKTQYVRKPNIKRGYYANVFQKKDKSYCFTVHQMVAELFVHNPDPKKLTWVNHIDTNKLNNDYRNLEWTTPSGNAQHAVDNGLFKINRHAVEQYDLDDNLIKTFESQTKAAEKTGIDRRLINAACIGRNKTAGGFKWKSLFNNENKVEIDFKGYKQIKTYPNYWINKEGKIYNKFTTRFIKPKQRMSGEEVDGVYIRLFKKEKDKKRVEKDVLLHRLVGLYFLKKPKDKKLNGVCHIDGDKTNNHVDNLKWCTMSHLKHVLEV